MTSGLLDGAEADSALREARVEGLLDDGDFRDPETDSVEVEVEILELDEQLEFGRHHFIADCRLQIAD